MKTENIDMIFALGTYGFGLYALLSLLPTNILAVLIGLIIVALLVIGFIDK